MLVVISRVLRRALGTLDLLGAEAHEPDLCVVHDLLLLKLSESLLETLQRVCNRAEEEEEEEDEMSHWRIDHSARSRGSRRVDRDVDALNKHRVTQQKVYSPVYNIPAGDMGSFRPSYAFSFSSLLLKILLLRETGTLSMEAPKRGVNIWLGFGLSSCPKDTRRYS